MTQNSNLFLSIGKEVKDDYGRVIGKVASLAITPSGKFDGVFVEQGDGKFLKHSAEFLEVNDEEVKLSSKIKMNEKILCDQIPLIWRKDQALRELSEKKKISADLYNELHASFDGVLTQLKNEAQTLTEEIDKETNRCAEETKALNYALVHLEIEHEVGKIDDSSYEKAFSIIQENLKKINREKTDLELTKNNLSNILLGDNPSAFEDLEVHTGEQSLKETASDDSVSELPEPPVVVYVKEIGKTGI